MSFHSRSKNTTDNNKQIVDPYKVVLHRVECLNKFYGNIVFDTVLNKLKFEDVHGMSHDLGSSKKKTIVDSNVDVDDMKEIVVDISTKIVNSKLDALDTGISFKSKWIEGENYIKGDMVTYDNNVYIADKDTTKIPSSVDWSLFYGNSINFTGEWKYGRTYKDNNLVVHNKCIYICLKNCESYMQPDADRDNWQIFISKEWFTPIEQESKSWLWSMFTGTTLEYDGKKACSMVDDVSCDFVQLIIDKKVNIPFDGVCKIVGSGIVHSGSIQFTQPGFYKLEYNIEHKKSTGGMFYITVASLKIPGSTRIVDAVDNLNIVHHSVPIYVNYNMLGGNVRLVFETTGKTIEIAPLSTWITIEKISNQIV